MFEAYWILFWWLYVDDITMSRWWLFGLPMISCGWWLCLNFQGLGKEIADGLSNCTPEMFLELDELAFVWDTKNWDCDKCYLRLLKIIRLLFFLRKRTRPITPVAKRGTMGSSGNELSKKPPNRIESGLSAFAMLTPNKQNNKKARIEGDIRNRFILKPHKQNSKKARIEGENNNRLIVNHHSHCSNYLTNNWKAGNVLMSRIH